MIQSALGDVRRRIEAAAVKAGRNSKEIEVVLVTKQVESKRILEAYQLGVRDFGENKVQELLPKIEELPKDIRWHFIGSLQTNKVKSMIEIVLLIHSCDRMELAEEINRQAEKINKDVRILIQVNTSGESSKHGFSPNDVQSAVSQMKGLKRLKIEGLMTIGPNTDNVNHIRESFRGLMVLRDQLKTSFTEYNWRYLSMGMSSDFELAVMEGANMLRIGSAVFGERKKQ